ncbi:MAG TPA: hypothetical protein VIG48_11285 [Jatrophihabitans sp.]|jgi:hypothetical protein
MNIDECLDRVAEIEAEIAALQAEQARLIASIADDPREGVPAPVLEKEYFRDELRAWPGRSLPTRPAPGAGWSPTTSAT